MNVSKGRIINQAISAVAVVLKPNDNYTLHMRVVRFMVGKLKGHFLILDYKRRNNAWHWIQALTQLSRLA